MKLIDAEKITDTIGRGLLVGSNLSKEKSWYDGYRCALEFALGVIVDAPAVPAELGYISADKLLADMNKRRFFVDRYQAPRFDITIAVRHAVETMVERQLGAENEKQKNEQS